MREPEARHGEDDAVADVGGGEQDRELQKPRATADETWWCEEKGGVPAASNGRQSGKGLDWDRREWHVWPGVE